jgi:hypothetical protein
MDEAPAAARARAIADGVAIRDALRAAAPTLEAVAAQLGTLTAAVSATPASVDYVAIDALASLEQPFTASAFASRSYLAFDPTTVDLLFHHYLTVIDLFQRIQRLAMSAAPQRRPELDRTAANLGATEQYGAVLTSVGGTVVAQLAFVEPVLDAAGAPTGRVRARPRRVGASIELDVFAGQPLDPSPRFVALIDGPSSRDVLARAGRRVRRLRAGARGPERDRGTGRRVAGRAPDCPRPDRGAGPSRVSPAVIGMLKPQPMRRPVDVAEREDPTGFGHRSRDRRRTAPPASRRSRSALSACRAPRTAWCCSRSENRRRRPWSRRRAAASALPEAR